MLIEVVLAELSAIVVLSAVTLFLEMLIFRHKSVLVLWKQSPPLCLFLTSATLLGFQNIAMSCQWIFFAAGSISNVPENTVFLLLVAHFGLVTRQFHNCVTVALFAQRVRCLMFPTKPLGKFNYFTLATVLTFFAVAACGTTYTLVVNVTLHGEPVPPGCFSFNCMIANSESVRMWASTSAVTITVGITVIGSFMLVLFFRYRKRNQSAAEKTSNNFTLYVFYIRFACETLPFLTDLVLAKAMYINLGKYVGPYGALGSTIDLTLKASAYYYLLVRSQVKVCKVSAARSTS
uniref:G_PROTEIN_RECEP_F1_2 domain-containing protein n=1 Tax=Steinernema glaseri TaxID=37863 RepID=A0A1I8AIK1_9BILA